jgi:hypothetical protein
VRVRDSEFLQQSLTSSNMRKKQTKKLSQFHKAKYLLESKLLV